MKINKQISIISSLSLAFTLGIGLAAHFNTSFEELDAHPQYTGSLPSTINLKDCTETTIRNYYANLNDLDVSERQGTNLLKHLKPILANNQTYYSYDKGSQIWQMYEIIDRDWEKSPADQLTYGTYNADDETITGYKYGNSASNSRNNPYIHALYINRELDNQTTAWDDHNQTAWGINREHIWAKSHGFDTIVSEDDSGGARGDPMHLWAGNGWANNVHSNQFFAFVDKSRIDKNFIDSGIKYGTAYDNYKGYSRTAGGNGLVFEPQDSDKGDIARAIFYMVARYNNYANATEGIDSNEPYLVLANDLVENERTGTSSYNDPYAMGLLSDLLAWNKLDPVDEFEIHRNNLLFNNYTHNRNPFIDFPEWADAIWGTADLDGKNYNSAVVGSANPISDAIAAPVVEFELSVPRVRVETGKLGEISAKNTSGIVTWSIDDPTIATLDKSSTTGNEKVTVTALKSGRATITAVCGGKTVTAGVIVTDPIPINYGTIDNPLTITEAKTLIDNNNPTLEKMYVKGIVSNSYFNHKSDHYNLVLQSEDGSDPEAFGFVDASIAPGVQEGFVGKEVIAYGYGHNIDGYYCLRPYIDSGVEIVSSKNPGDKTPKELVELKETSTSLAFNYSRDDNALIEDTDIITRAETGVTSTSYSDWTYTDEYSNITYSGNSAGGKSSVQLRSNEKNSGVVITSNTGSKKINRITVNWNTDTADGRTLNIYGKDSAYVSAADLYNQDTQGTLLGTIVKGTSTSLTISGDYEYIGFRSNKDAMYLTSINIDWSYIGTAFNYSKLSIRFGGTLSQELWNEVDTDNHIIEGFGVMIATEDVIGKDAEIKNLYESASPSTSNPNISEEMVDYFVPVEQLNTIIGVNGDNYFWNLRYEISDFKVTYVAAAYIKTSSGYIFFKQAKQSVKSLAQDYLDNRNYDENSYDGSIAYLANLR